MRKLVIVLSAVVFASVAQAATPSEGVPLQVRRGFFTETDIGGLVNLGGLNGYSNFQTYLQLGVGYQFAVGTKHAIPIGFHVGIGANAANCYGAALKGTDCVADDGKTLLADNFTMTFLNVTAGYMYQVLERFYVGGKVLLGYTLLDPAPVVGVNGGFTFGLGAGIEYATNMDHFTIGFDIIYRLVAGPGINSLQFLPRVKYTF